MECNRDEALRAREIAEKKFDANDYVGAKKFALKAQNLYPDLEGVPHMLATLDVHICASNKINGESDWYGILGTAPSADDETIKKQYRRLALMLHPDKNKSTGAEGAFTLIAEAWNLLSDKSKRALYDQRRRAQASYTKAAPPSQRRKAPPKTNGVFDFAKYGGFKKNASQVNKPSVYGDADTFWAVCFRCKLHYEYPRLYLNFYLLCRTCQHPFMAIETRSPVSNRFKTPSYWITSHPQRNSDVGSATKRKACNSMSGGSVNGAATYRWTPSSQNGAPNISFAARLVVQSNEKDKREHEKSSAVKRGDKDLKRKHHAHEREAGVFSTEQSVSAKKRKGFEESGPRTVTDPGSTGAGLISTASPSLRHGISDTIQVNNVKKTYSVRKMSQIDIRATLMEKARSTIRKGVNDYKSGKRKHDYNQTKHPNGIDQKESAAFVDKKSGNPISSGLPAAAENGVGTRDLLNMIVPDPDFHDFDKDRSDAAFEANQVWASYDNDDGMPRFYGIIHAVLSRSPFKVRVSWLNVDTNTDTNSLKWVRSGFSKTCGSFRAGGHEVTGSLNSFSHIVRWTKGTQGTILILPRKGDVWAMYQNWSPDWNQHTPNDTVHKYVMVEVLDDYDEEAGVAVAPLIKVSGFKTVFHRNPDQGQIQKIPKNEILRFSHQVPRYMLTSQEASDAPEGCMELDPASTPPYLLNETVDGQKKKSNEKVIEILEID